MFHHAHAYLASKIYKSEKNLLLVGAILPDIAVTKIIRWDAGLHGSENAKKFNQFIEEKYPNYLDLANGVIAHNIVDDFSHTDYPGGTGYAFQNNKKLVKLIMEYYEIEEASAQGKAHNYIESAVDIMLLNDHPEIQVQLKRAIKETSTKELSRVLSEYFAVDQKQFIVALDDFFSQFTKYDFSSQSSWLLFWADLEKLIDLKDIGDQKRQELLNEALSVVKNTYQDFLEYSISEGSKKVKTHRIDHLKY